MFEPAHAGIGFDDVGPTASAVHVSIIETLDQTWSQLSRSLDGLTQADYLWEPAAHCWTVDSDADGAIKVDRSDEDPDPAPVTTIAWRMWHSAMDCLDGYATRLGDGTTGTSLTGDTWVVDAEEAMELVSAA